MIHTEHARIRTRDCDLYGRWKPSTILEAMQAVAIGHCESVGLGRDATDALGVVWVLSRCRVELSRLPRNGETVSVSTWPMPTRHLFFPRAHEFRDERGAVIGCACGLWLLMDPNTRRAVANLSVAERLRIEEVPSPAAAPATVRPMPGEPEIQSFQPRLCDYDLNGHVNNARYLDWCWNALGFEALRNQEIACFDVNYDREILPGETVRAELCRLEDGFSFCGYIENRRSFGIIGRLRAAER